MKIYSNYLTETGLRAALPPKVNFERIDEIHKPKLRRFGWSVLLWRQGSKRHFNTGKHGAGAEGAASYDDYGRWLARLYEADDRLVVVGAGRYEDIDEFHRKTQFKFSQIVP